MRSCLLDRNSPLADHLDIGVLSSIVEDHESEKRDWSKQLFCLMMLGLQMQSVRCEASANRGAIDAIQPNRGEQ